MPDPVMTVDLEPVRCYRCSEDFEARRADLDTVCPSCGSDSFYRVREV